MGRSGFSRWAFCVCAALSLAGCGAQSSMGTLPILPAEGRITVDPGYKVTSGLLYVALFNVRPPYDEVLVG